MTNDDKRLIVTSIEFCFANIEFNQKLLNSVINLFLGRKIAEELLNEYQLELNKLHEWGNELTDRLDEWQNE